MAMNLAERQQTRKACQAIVRYIHQQKLDVGSLLPPAQVLGRELGICNGTLQSAMEVLVEGGMVERRKRLGTTVCRPMPGEEVPGLFTVGVLWEKKEAASYHDVLYRMVCEELHARSCAIRTYFYDMPDYAGFSPVADYTEYPQLAADVGAGAVDAVVSQRALKATIGLPVASTSPYALEVAGVRLGHWRRGFYRDALSIVRLDGRKHPLVIATATHLPQDYSIDRKQLVGTLTAEGWGSDDNHLLVDAHTLGDADALVSGIVRRRMPDAVIVTDDHLGVRVANLFRGEANPPLFIVQTNRQIPIGFAIPAVRMELDIAAIAHGLVEPLVRQVLDPQSPPVTSQAMCRPAFTDLPEEQAERLGAAWEQRDCAVMAEG